MDLPEDLKYTREHEWARREGNRITVGITDYAQKELGDVVYVDLPPLGRTVSQGESFGVVESVKTVSDLYAPVGGKVVAGNEELVQKPELVNSSPYGEGWMIVIELSQAEELDNLLDARAYRALVEGQGS
ncbi:MAG: glycine cleavage system protein GcvH [Candidatus Tectomicrobia bacterium]|uniref:Glycine cleavage system H protein n=1 Tax=Tectimicrobiota bacterium TaxID=2528274 RepID=A0A932M020_UNCTE|nr:glycine cleavage system protein GcvH [Candidatus Tectomicrobia bacterium]